MLINRKFQLFGMAILTVAVTLATVSAVKPPSRLDLSWPARPDFSFLAQNDRVFATSNEAGVAQYQRSERSAYSVAASGLAVYHLSERVLAYPATIKAQGLAQYYRSERMQPVKWTILNNRWSKFHQSESLK